MHELHKIFDHIKAEYPKEACGVLAQKGEEITWIPCNNISDDPENGFELDKRQYIQAVLDYDDIITIVHSHTDESAEPSEHDIKACNFLNIPYMIISWPGNEITTLNPGDRHE